MGVHLFLAVLYTDMVSVSWGKPCFFQASGRSQLVVSALALAGPGRL